MTDEAKRDGRLVAAVAAGSRAALGELYERHAAQLLGLAYRILGSRRDAEDLLHDVFVEAWQKARSYDASRGSVRTWLSLRVRSRAIDRARSLATARAFAMADRAAGPPPSIPAEQSRAPDRVRARQALESLSKEQRIVIELAYFEGLSARDVGERVGIPIGTVKSRLFAALAKLREELGASGRIRP
jgi:RNA polymerase sigma-70 factor (ECF subfamily)